MSTAHLWFQHPHPQLQLSAAMEYKDCSFCFLFPLNVFLITKIELDCCTQTDVRLLPGPLGWKVGPPLDAHPPPAPACLCPGEPLPPVEEGTALTSLFLPSLMEFRVTDSRDSHLPCCNVADKGGVPQHLV
ncbi:hypothetical protein H1C71_008033 [Ictidomys tridecemlineatus]|nr:hypothetical protein H1C71_008033 [Ictidomys tridecemlineatus]